MPPVRFKSRLSQGLCNKIGENENFRFISQLRNMRICFAHPTVHCLIILSVAPLDISRSFWQCSKTVYTVGVAQVVERQTVDLGAVGSNPITHPTAAPGRGFGRKPKGFGDLGIAMRS